MDGEHPKKSRWVRRSLMAGAAIVALLAIYYGVEDWLGHRAWNEYRQDYETQVGPLEFQAYIPKSIADADNFCATPFVRSWFNSSLLKSSLYATDAWSRASAVVTEPTKKELGSHAKRRFVDLVAWQRAVAAIRSGTLKNNDQFRTKQLDLAARAQAAPAVLDAMKDDDAVIDELRAASVRPEARYPIVYKTEDPWAIVLPHLAQMKSTCQRLGTRACAELAAGQSDRALADVRLMSYLAGTVRTEPFLISYLVRCACLHLAVEPIWEGLAERRWTDAQLQQLQGGLEQLDYLAAMTQVMRAEGTFGIGLVDRMKEKGTAAFASYGSSGNMSLEYALVRIVPSGWYDFEKLHYCQALDQLLDGIEDEASKRIHPRRFDTDLLENKTKFYIVFRHHLLESMFIPGVSRAPLKAAWAQTAIDQADIACALERYRLANGQFPETLDVLTPRFLARLPNDVISGGPFKYRRTDDGNFILYSIGWNEKDDGGVTGPNLFDQNEGDWVWEYPAEK